MMNFMKFKIEEKRKKLTDFNELRKTIDEVSDKKIVLKNYEKH